jgi:hypothetical protein
MARYSLLDDEEAAVEGATRNDDANGLSCPAR